MFLKYSHLVELADLLKAKEGQHRPLDPIFNLSTTPPQEAQELVEVSLEEHPSGLATVLKASLPATGFPLSVWRFTSGREGFLDAGELLATAKGFIEKHEEGVAYA